MFLLFYHFLLFPLQLSNGALSPALSLDPLLSGAMDSSLTASPALLPPTLSHSWTDEWVPDSSLLHYVSDFERHVRQSPPLPHLLPSALVPNLRACPRSSHASSPRQLESPNSSPASIPSPSNLSALCCQTNLSQAKLDLISSQHRKLVAHYCLLKKDQPLWRGIQTSLRAS